MAEPSGYYSTTMNCFCGTRAYVRTSWTDDNPGRRFNGCGRYMTREQGCNMFIWEDPPMCNRAVQVIPPLLRKLNTVKDENTSLRNINREILNAMDKVQEENNLLEEEKQALLQERRNLLKEKKKVEEENRKLKCKINQQFKLLVVMPLLFAFCCWLGMISNKGTRSSNFKMII